MEKYSSLERKRFAIPTEEVARERLGKIKEVYRELKQQYPEIISFGLYGSYSKGYAIEKSDIDAWVFIDAEKAQANYGWGLPRAELRKLERRWTKLPQQELKDAVTAEYFKNVARKALIGKLDMWVSQVRNVDAALLSKERIDRELGNTGNLFARREGYLFRSPLMTMFYLSTDNDIMPYRRYLLERLRGMGRKRGEGIWKGIAHSLQAFEREYAGLPAGEESLYPQTIEEAMKRLT